LFDDETIGAGDANPRQDDSRTIDAPGRGVDQVQLHLWIVLAHQ